MTTPSDAFAVNRVRNVSPTWGRRLRMFCGRAAAPLILMATIGSSVVSQTQADDNDGAVPIFVAEPQIILRRQPVGRIVLDGGLVRNVFVIDNINDIELLQTEDYSASDAETQRRFVSLLDSQSQAMIRLYSLSAAQAKKLSLAGKGDIHQYFSRLSEIRSKSTSAPPQGEHVDALLKEHQNSLRGGIFGDESLFQKTLRTILNDEQRARYQSIEREQQRRILESVMLDWDRTADRFKLWGEPRKKFIELLVPHLHVPANAGAFSHSIVFLEAWRHRDQIRPLLTAAEWEKFEWQVNRAREAIPTLEARGFWTSFPSDDDGESTPDTSNE